MPSSRCTWRRPVPPLPLERRSAARLVSSADLDDASADRKPKANSHQFRPPAQRHRGGLVAPSVEMLQASHALLSSRPNSSAGQDPHPPVGLAEEDLVGLVGEEAVL